MHKTRQWHRGKHNEQMKEPVTIIVRGTVDRYTLPRARALELYVRGKLQWDTHFMDYITPTDRKVE